MKTRFDPKGFDAAERRLKQTGVNIMRGSAAQAQQTAQRESPVDTGALRRGIVLIPTEAGAHVVSTSPISVFIEYGTGRYGERPGRQTPWTYYSPDYGFVTTTGHPPQKFMKPGFEAGVSEFHRQKRRRGL